MPRAGLWWGSLEGADLETLASSAGASGFATVSATPAMVFAAIERHGPRLQRVLDELGVDVVMIDPLIRGLPGARDPATVNPRWRSTFLHDEDDCHRAADAVGAAVINVAHFLGAPVGQAALTGALAAITARALARGRRIAIEAMPEGGIPDLRTAASIASAVGHPGCGVTFDTWHWWRSGGDLAELTDLPDAMVLAVQLSDATAGARGSGLHPPSPDRLLPGAGALPLREVLAVVARAHPDAMVGIEVFDRGGASDPPGDRAQRAASATFALLAG